MKPLPAVLLFLLHAIPVPGTTAAADRPEKSQSKTTDTPAAAAQDIGQKAYEAALALLSAGKYAEAEQSLRLLMMARTQALGAEHADTLRCRESLVQALEKQHKHAAAEAEMQELVSLFTRVKGAEDRATLSHRAAFIGILLAQGRFQMAKEQCRSLAATESRVLGAEDAETLKARLLHASALLQQGHAAEAETICRDVAALCARVSGAEHRTTLVARTQLAWTLYAQDRHAEAEAQLRELAPLLSRVLGPEDEATFDCETALAKCLSGMDRKPEVLEICRRVLPGATRVLGPEDHRVLQIRATLARDLHDHGKKEEAEKELRQMLATRQSRYGADDLWSIYVLDLLLQALRMNEKHAEAEHTAWKLIAIRTRVLGPQHPKTLDTRMDLAHELEALGRAPEAEQEMRAILAIQKQEPGAETDTSLLDTCHELALHLKSHGQAQEALHYAQHALTGRLRLLGENAPDTQDSQILVNLLTYPPPSGTQTGAKAAAPPPEKDPPLAMVDGAVIRTSAVQAVLKNQPLPCTLTSLSDAQAQPDPAEANENTLDAHEALLKHYAAGRHTQGRPQLQDAPEQPLVEQVLAERKHAALENLIDQQLLLNEFHRTRRVIKKSYVDDDIARLIRDSFNGSRETYLTALAAEGRNEKAFRAERERAIIVNVMRGLIGGEADIPEKEARAYYDKHQDCWIKDAEVKLHTLTLIHPGPEARREAEMLRTRILKGADFGELARTRSQDSHAEDGGAWEWTPVADLSPQVKAAISQTRKGGVSGLVEQEGRLIILRVDDRRASPAPPFEKVKTEVTRILQDEQRQKRIAARLDELRRKADIRLLETPGI